jgi:glycosyltransferase involved in cell wall biosynthesis
MNIGINLMGESRLRTGTGRYSTELLKEILKAGTNDRFFIFIPAYEKTEFLIESPSITYIRLPAEENVFLRRIVEQLLLPFYVLGVKIKYGLDVLHSTNNVSPVILFKLNTVSIHDMARWRTQTDKWYKNYFLKILCFLTAWVSRKIITISENSKNDIAEITGIKSDKIVSKTITVGRTDYFKVISQEAAEKVLKENNVLLSKPYIMCLSSIEHRKNYVRLVEALNETQLDLDLVICGKKSSGYESLVSKIKELKMENRVHIQLFPSDELYLALINRSMFYTFVSIFEGAGMTPLEAMHCKKAVLLSDIPVLREYCGDAAYYVNPYDVKSIAEGIKTLYTNSRLRIELEDKGYEQVKKFNWEDHARALIKIWHNE